MMGFYQDLKLVGPMCQCPVETKHTGSDLPWTMAVVPHLAFIPWEAVLQLICYSPMKQQFLLPSSCNGSEHLSCTGSRILPLCRVVALELACLAGSAGTPQEWELLTWKELTDQLYFFSLYKGIGSC